MKRKIGLSLGGFQRKYGDFEALNMACRAGADAVDIDTCDGPLWDFREPDSVYSRGDEGIEDYFSRLRQHAHRLGLTISQTHGRLRGYSGNPDQDAATLENARLDLLAASALGAPVCVMHSVASGMVGLETPPDTIRELNLRMYTDILPYAKKYGVKVAMETFGDSAQYGVIDFFGQQNELMASYEAIAALDDNRQWLTICADTGHSNKAMRFGQPTPGDVIRQLGSRVTLLHLHDNDTLTDQHKPPLSGCIDWNDVLSALDEIHYQGVYNMELNLCCFGETLMQDTAAFAVKVMRQMLIDRYGMDA